MSDQEINVECKFEKLKYSVLDFVKDIPYILLKDDAKKCFPSEHFKGISKWVPHILKISLEKSVTSFKKMEKFFNRNNDDIAIMKKSYSPSVSLDLTFREIGYIAGNKRVPDNITSQEDIIRLIIICLISGNIAILDKFIGKCDYISEIIKFWSFEIPINVIDTYKEKFNKTINYLFLNGFITDEIFNHFYEKGTPVLSLIVNNCKGNYFKKIFYLIPDSEFNTKIKSWGKLFNPLYKCSDQIVMQLSIKKMTDQNLIELVFDTFNFLMMNKSTTGRVNRSLVHTFHYVIMCNAARGLFDKNKNGQIDLHAFNLKKKNGGLLPSRVVKCPIVYQAITSVNAHILVKLGFFKKISSSHLVNPLYWYGNDSINMDNYLETQETCKLFSMTGIINRTIKCSINDPGFPISSCSKSGVVHFLVCFIRNKKTRILPFLPLELQLMIIEHLPKYSWITPVMKKPDLSSIGYNYI